MEITEESTEAVTFPDKNGNLIVEITPYPSMGIAQVVIMSPEQSREIAEYTRRQCNILQELGKADLLLDITYIPEEKWKDEILRRVPAGSTVFPVADLRTVPLEHVKCSLR